MYCSRLQMAGRPVQGFEGREEGSVIFHCGDGYHYNVRELRGLRVRLQCRHYKSRARGCTATAYISLDTELLYHLQPHNHAPDPLLMDDMILRRATIEEARTNAVGRKLRNILNEMKIR